MSKDNLVPLIHRVLLVILDGLNFRLQVGVAACRVQVHGAEGANRQLNVVDMVKNHRLVVLWQGHVQPSLPLLPDNSLDESPSDVLGQQSKDGAGQDPAGESHCGARFLFEAERVLGLLGLGNLEQKLESQVNPRWISFSFPVRLFPKRRRNSVRDELQLHHPVKV